jgi:predicted lipoprotein with Yx(FWY)xxD motif
VSRPLALSSFAVAAAVLAVGCGSSKSTTTTTAAGGAPPTSSSASAYPAYTATGASATTTTTAGALVSTKRVKLGTVLATGPKQRTVYLFEGDKGSASACSGSCARVWPPVTTTGNPRAGGAAAAASLGTIKRPDGSMQVTYRGHPLYTYSSDKDTSDSYGQGIKSFGADWYVIAPTGQKIDKS